MRRVQNAAWYLQIMPLPYQKSATDRIIDLERTLLEILPYLVTDRGTVAEHCLIPHDVYDKAIETLSGK